MDQMEHKPRMPEMMDKPFVGFIVILLVALFVGGWLYVDSVRGELEMKIDSLSSQVDGMKAEARMKDQAAQQEMKAAQQAMEAATGTPQ